VSDRRTLAAYAARVEAYDALQARDEAWADREAFLAALPPGTGPVLDWGCGPGRDAVAMRAAGAAVEATDASPGMAARARAAGLPCRVEPFEALPPAPPRFRGIWARFSLLHARAEALRGLVALAAGTLLPGGVLHLGMKRGAGSARDALGRRYAYVEAADLDRMTGAAGLRRLSVRTGEGEGLDGTRAPFVAHLSRRPAGAAA
jgi:SAM-dependent methyltransferase